MKFSVPSVSLCEPHLSHGTMLAKQPAYPFPVPHSPFPIPQCPH